MSGTFRKGGLLMLNGKSCLSSSFVKGEGQMAESGEEREAELETRKKKKQ